MGKLYDCHCHILPGVDDGAQTMEDALQLLRIASADGIEKMVLTPHLHIGERMEEKIKRIKSSFKNLCEHASKEGNLPELYLGNEIYASYDMAECLKKGEALTINESDYTLVEFHPGTHFYEMRNILKNLRTSGYQIVLAHVERYECLYDKREYVDELVDQGILLQCNAAAVIGKEGLRKKRFIRRLMQEREVYLIGTDSHDIKKRVPNMSACYSFLCRKFGIEYADMLCSENIEKILGRK